MITSGKRNGKQRKLDFSYTFSILFSSCFYKFISLHSRKHWNWGLEYSIARNIIVYHSTNFLLHNLNMNPDRKDLLSKDKKAKRPKAQCMKNILQTLHY